MFQSTPPTRAATGQTCIIASNWAFQSTPPTRAATVRSRQPAQGAGGFNPRRPRGRRQGERTGVAGNDPVSIHAAHAGGDRLAGWKYDGVGWFQSTPPTRAATGVLVVPNSGMMFQSTPPTRAATISVGLTAYNNMVSIHAAHAGGDRSLPDLPSLRWVSIHAAHAGGDALVSHGPGEHTVSIHAAHAGGDAWGLWV